MESTWSPAIERLLARLDAIELIGTCTAEATLGALIEDDESLPASRLMQAGIDLESLRIQLAESRSEQPIDRPLWLRTAKSLSRDHGQDHLTSDVLLIALLTISLSLEQHLIRLGLDTDAMRKRILPEIPTLPDSLSLTPLADPMDLYGAARVLDVGANRARESLRILDDYCRFVLEDRFLTESIKQIRHDLVEVLNQLPAEVLLESRETIRDVGTTIQTASELTRTDLREVARINLKRLQEALRSLEEFGKLFSTDVGTKVEAIRYRVYTLEQAIVRGVEMRDRLRDARLYVLLTGAHCVASLDWTIAEAAAGGAQIVQLREKSLPDRELIDRAKIVRRACDQAGILFIMNDRPDIARLVGADGVHLGQDDMTVQSARQILGPNRLIGVSTHRIEQVRQAILDGASYLGIGPAFATATKPHEPVAGLEFLQEAIAETTLPLFAIGGINLDTVAKVVTIGVTRIAVSSVIAQADEPKPVAIALREALG